jgi:superfamily I DNA/RNA helicase/RecB family exonuclease
VRLDRRAPGRLAAPALDRQQRAVIEHRDGHLLVLAGPGTGKTTTLAELVVSRIADPVDPIPADRILALTFGRRAARELSDRISGRLGGGAVPVVSTFHSFAYGVLRQHADPTAFASPPRLLVAAEQDARLRELLTYAIEEGRLQWPESLSRAIGTRGIAEQVRTLLARARGQGLDGKDLTRIGKREGVPVWAALGGFFEEYLATLEFEGSLDYAELILRAAVLANDPRAGRELREMFRLIVVDEYQDTDPAQVALLRGLAGGGAQVVAVGDPDQAIYGFRGADVRGILRFPDVFADPTGQPARIEVLRTTRRFPQAIAEAASGVLGPVSLAPLPAEVQRLHRTPVAAEGPARVEVRTFPTAAAEAAGVAETLLRAHAGEAGAVGRPAPPGDAGSPEASALPGEPGGPGGPGGTGLAWSQMAVLVRNPAVHGPVLARAMRAAGIPVWLPPDETPLGDEPAVGVLLSVLGLALDPSTAPDDAGRTLLAGPLGRADAVAIRALARAVLKEHRGSGGMSDSPEPGDSSDALLTAALARGVLPADCTDVPRSAVAAFRRVSKAIAAARDAMRAGQIVSEVLWSVWSATDWPDRLRTAALRPDGGHTAAASAHRDLDAVVALFELANRLPAQRLGEVGTAAFVEDINALRLPQEVRGAQESDRDHVRLLSAHRAKGLEWELVVVASVQEGQWPDVRLRSDLLHVAELGPRGRIEGLNHADLLAEERRLMYVACTRARSALVVSAVAERVEGGLQASRFLAELGQDVRAMPARSASPMSAEGLIAALREAAQAPTQVGPDGSPDPEVEVLRGAAIQRLAALAVRARESGPLGPMAAADPVRWWGAQPLTGAGVPVAEGSVPLAGSVSEGSLASDGSAAPGEGTPGPSTPRPLRLSPSAVAALRDCPLRWFLDRRVGAGNPSGGAAVVGLVVHAVAEAIARGDVAPDEREIRPFVDEIWASVPFPAHYQRVHERQRVDDMITALLAWDASTGRSVAATELTFNLPVPGAPRPVHVSGSIDRVDRAEDGSLHVVDFKTGRTAASAAATAEHPQLGIYQLAIRLGALDVTDPVHLGQAELVHLADRFTSGMPKVRIQAPLDDGWTWVNDLIVDAARLADGPDYPARPNGHCKSCAFRFMCPAQSPPASRPLTATPGPAAAEPPAETERVSAPATAESAAEERPVPASEPAEPEPAEPAPGDPAPAPGEPADGDAGSSADPATPPSGPARPARPAARKRPANPDAPVQQPLWGEDL